MSDEVSVLDDSAMNIVLIIRNALFSLPTYVKLNADTDEKNIENAPQILETHFQSSLFQNFPGGHVPGKLKGA